MSSSRMDRRRFLALTSASCASLCLPTAGFSALTKGVVSTGPKPWPYPIGFLPADSQAEQRLMDARKVLTGDQQLVQQGVYLLYLGISQPRIPVRYDATWALDINFRPFHDYPFRLFQQASCQVEASSLPCQMVVPITTSSGLNLSLHRRDSSGTTEIFGIHLDAGRTIRSAKLQRGRYFIPLYKGQIRWSSIKNPDLTTGRLDCPYPCAMFSVDADRSA